MEIKTGGPAFPAVDENFGETDHSLTGRASPGMTLRDYFAAKAMQGIVSLIQDHMPGQAVIIAHQAYLIADAMLEARK